MIANTTRKELDEELLLLDAIEANSRQIFYQVLLLLGCIIFYVVLKSSISFFSPRLLMKK